MTNQHLHFIHDCNYYNSQCRCSIIHGIPIKSRRGSRNGKWTTELTEIYLQHLTIYLSSEERYIIQIKVGRQSWGLLNTTEDISKIGFESDEFRKMVDACEEKDASSNRPSRRNSNESIDNVSKRSGTAYSTKSKFPRRGPSSYTILQWFKVNLPYSANNAPQSVQWINETNLYLISRSHKEFKEAIDAYDRWIHIKTLEELYDYLKYVPMILIFRTKKL